MANEIKPGDDQQPDKSCVINVWNMPGIALDPEVLNGVMQQCAARYVGEARSVDVYTSARREDGYAEWLLRVTYFSGTVLTVGVVQRAPALEVEFHT